MIKISSAEFRRDIGRYEALARAEPVAVTLGQDGGEDVVLISAREYRRLERRDQIAFLAEETPGRFLAAIEAAGGGGH